jgi:hypothetical protein
MTPTLSRLVRCRPVATAVVLLLALATIVLAPRAVAFTPAPHRNPPAVPNYGHKLKPLRIIAMIPTTYPHAAALESFALAITASHWLAAVQTAYPVPAGSPPNASTTVFQVTDMPSLVTQSRTVGEYQDYIFQKLIDDGIPSDRSRQTIFLMFIPCTDPHGMDHFGCTSHHPALDANRVSPHGLPEGIEFTAGDSMAVNLGPASEALDLRTIATSHEMTEAYTDTAPLAKFNIHSLFPSDPWIDAPPWVRASGSIELADMSEGSQWFETDPVSGLDFAYERIYSTFRTSHGFDDVDVPSGPHAFYNLSTPQGNLPTDWHSSTYPSVPSVPVAAWATAAIGDWTVTASISSAGGVSSKPCSLPVKSWTVHNGSTFNLGVDTVPVTAANAHVWCVVKLHSVRPNAAADDDRFHEWFVGFVVESPN